MNMKKSILPMALALVAMGEVPQSFATAYSSKSHRTFTPTYVNGRYSRLDSLKIAKRRAKNKLARMSRHINRN